MPNAINGHPFLIEVLGENGNGEWHHVFNVISDERKITIHAFIFNIYLILRIDIKIIRNDISNRIF